MRSASLFLLLAAGLAFAACGSDPAVSTPSPAADAGNAQLPRPQTMPSDAGDPPDAASTTDAGSDAVADAGPDTAAHAAFLAVESELQKRCGSGCHDTATKEAASPKFLAGPDVYASLRTYAGVVQRNVFQSLLLTKGTHAGPAVSDQADFQKGVIAWLEAEADALPWNPTLTSAFVTVVIGENDVPLAAAPASGLPSAHVAFSASLVGTALALSHVRITAASKVHIASPRFIRMEGSKKVRDPSDTFANIDETVSAGVETAFAPSSVIFSSESWRPFDVVNDRLRIEILASDP